MGLILNDLVAAVATTIAAAAAAVTTSTEICRWTNDDAINNDPSREKQ